MSGNGICSKKERTFSAPRIFFFLVLVLVSLRFCVLYTSLERVCWNEELGMGAVGRDFLKPDHFPWWDYQLDTYAGESIVVGGLAAVFFGFLGPTLFALKMSPLFFIVSVFSLLFLFVKRYFGTRSAFAVSVLFIFGPPSFIRHSLLLMCGHFEPLLFSFGALFCFYEFFYGKKHPRLFLAGFGLLSGIGLWFSYESALTTMSCLLAWLVSRRGKFFGPDLWLFMVLILLGFSPGILYNLQRSSQGEHLLSSAFSSIGSLSYFTDLIESPIKMLTVGVPASFGFLPETGWAGRYLSYGYAFTMLALTGPSIAREIFSGKPTRLFPLAVYPFLFILAYAALRFPVPDKEVFLISFRYFTPLHFFLILLASLPAFDRRKAFLWLVLILFGVAGHKELLFKEAPGRMFLYKGYSYYQLGWPWQYLFSPQTHQEHLSKRRQDPDYRFVYWALLDVLDLKKEELDTAEKITQKKQELPENYRPLFLEGLGRFWGRGELSWDRASSLMTSVPREEKCFFYLGFMSQIGYKGLEDLLSYKQPLESMEPEARNPFYFNLGQLLYPREGDIPLSDLDRLLEAWSMRPEERQWFLRGLGAQAGVEWAYERVPFVKAWKNLPLDYHPEDKPALFWGVGWGTGGEFPEDEIRVLDWLKTLPEDGREDAVRGYRAFQRWYRLPAGKESRI